MTVVLRVELDGGGDGPGVDLALDLVSDVLWTHGAHGVATDEGERGVRLTSSFPEGVDPSAVAAAVVAAVPAARPSLTEDDGGWWDAWREHARPVVAASGRVVVAPAWQPTPAPAAPGGVVITIDPGRTFGSGAHATTRLCVDALATLALDGRRVLDVGCGSGVLSVVAARLGAAEVVGVDVDPACVEATVANAAANGVGERVRATVASLRVLDGTFDVVVANVLLPVLEALAVDIARLAVGPVVVSGMLDGTEGRAAAALGHGWRLAACWSDDGWTTALLVPVDLLT